MKSKDFILNGLIPININSYPTYKGRRCDGELIFTKSFIKIKYSCTFQEYEKIDEFVNINNISFYKSGFYDNNNEKGIFYLIEKNSN